MQTTHNAVSNAFPPSNGRIGLVHLIASDICAWKRIWMPDRPLRGAGALLDTLKLLVNQMGVRATLFYRLSHGCNKQCIPFLPGMLSRLNLTLHGLDIPASVEIGSGFYMPHPVGTVIMAHRIGANVSIISGITIGMRGVPEFPIIGNDVFIGAGARILGGITIGDAARIGANAVVLTDVPAGATAIGVPARIKTPQTRMEE